MSKIKPGKLYTIKVISKTGTEHVREHVDALNAIVITGDFEMAYPKYFEKYPERLQVIEEK